MHPRAVLPLPIFLALALPARAQSAADARWVSQCRERGDEGRARHCEVRVLTIVPGGAIAVDPGQNGGVAVEGWDAGSIEVHARIQTEGATEDDAAALAREINVVSAGTTVGAAGPASGRRHSWGVSFVLYVPRRSDLKLDTYNGPIAVRDVTGRMALTAYNGPVSLEGVGGDVRARKIGRASWRERGEVVGVGVTL